MNRKRVLYGIVGGLAGGAVFGMLMGMMGMLPMLGRMVGLPTAAGGFLVHMMISAMFGAAYAVVLGRRADSPGRAVVLGLAYGLFWWLLGPLTLMPLMMGMGLGVNWNAGAMIQMMPSLMGHLVYGAILGAVFGALERRAASCACEAPQVRTARGLTR